MKLSEAEHVVDYMISWPIAAPGDAYRAGEKYPLLGAVLAVFLGIPVIFLRLPIGTGMAGINWAKSRRE